MAKILKQLVFGQKKNPPAPPRPDYQGEGPPKDEFADHDYENIPRFNSEGGSRVQFQEKKEPELLVFENYSEPADLLRSLAAPSDEEEEVYMAPVDDASHLHQMPSAPPLEEEMYCVPYEDETTPSLPDPCLTTGNVRSRSTERLQPADGDDEAVEYDEPWEWSVGARLSHSLHVQQRLEEDSETVAAAMSQQQRRRMLYETAFDSVRVERSTGANASGESPAVTRAASRSSFGSSTSGSSASSTPTHQGGEERRFRLRSLSPLVTNGRPHHNWTTDSSRSSSQESIDPPAESRLLRNNRRNDCGWKENRHHREDAKKMTTPGGVRVLPTDNGPCLLQKPPQPSLGDLKENHRSSSDLPPVVRPARPASLRPLDDNARPDPRPEDEYDPPWDVGRPSLGSVSVPERLSAAASVVEDSGKEQIAKPPAKPSGIRPNLNLNLNLNSDSPRKNRQNLSLNFGCAALSAVGEKVDVEVTLEKQGWYHGSISRLDAENLLRVLKEGSYLVRNSESSKQDYSLSLRSARGFMHMKIVQSDGRYILGQFSNPFASIPEMIHHYSINKLPIKGAEHMSLLYPVIDQLL